MMKKRIALVVLSLMSFALLPACSTTQSKALKRVQVGMDKASVLEIVGNPSRISRHLGQDRWSYENANSDTGTAEARTTFVYFAEGRVTHIGPATEGKTENGNQKPAAAEKDASGEFKPIE